MAVSIQTLIGLFTHEYPSVEDDLEEVVSQHGVLEAVWLAASHVERAQHPHYRQVEAAQHHRGQRRGHQSPGGHAGVSLDTVLLTVFTLFREAFSLLNAPYRPYTIKNLSRQN